MMYDVIIIGAGVSGAASARELSRYQVQACVLEREEDVCSGTSKANSGIAHAGFDAPVGSLMAKLNVEGSKRMPELAKELDFPFAACGSMVVCHDEARIGELEELKARGQENGVEGLKVITDLNRLRGMEPNLADDVVAALWAPTGGIVCPFGLNIALAENAAVNGVDFKFDTEVQNIRRTERGWAVDTNNGTFEAAVVVNAAGVYADKLHNMVSQQKIHITPRKGEYCLLDKSAGSHVKHTIFGLPDAYGKGVLVTPTTHGNLLVGPTATDIEDKECIATTREGLDQVVSKAGRNVKDLPMRQVITSFAGLRAHEDGHEFVIGEVADPPGLVAFAGIEPPGLTSAPAIGKMVADIVADLLDLKPDPGFVGRRQGILDPKKLTREEQADLIRRQPAYGNIICRCEMVTEGEILDAIHRPLGARSLDGVKRRTRAGMGRCQAGFCSPKTMEILNRELDIPMTQLTKAGGASRLVVGTNKDQM